MELVKTQMQVSGQGGLAETVAGISRQAGLAGFSRGLGITLTREVPAFGVYFGSYEVRRAPAPELELVVQVMVRGMGEGTAAVLTAGGTAGILSWLLTYPQVRRPPGSGTAC